MLTDVRRKCEAVFRQRFLHFIDQLRYCLASLFGENLFSSASDFEVKVPNDVDHSLGADLLRIKYYRNEVYAHSNNLEIPDEDFLDRWGKISEALLRIAAHLCPEKQNNWKDAMEKFLRDPFTPGEERYAEELEL